MISTSLSVLIFVADLISATDPSSKIIIATSIYAYWEQNGAANNRGDVNLSYKTL